MVEALVCTSDWLRADTPSLYKDPTEEDLKFYYELEELEKGNGVSNWLQTVKHCEFTEFNGIHSFLFYLTI